MKLSNTLIKLGICLVHKSLSFITEFTNLQNLYLYILGYSRKNFDVDYQFIRMARSHNPPKKLYYYIVHKSFSLDAISDFQWSQLLVKIFPLTYCLILYDDLIIDSKELIEIFSSAKMINNRIFNFFSHCCADPRNLFFQLINNQFSAVIWRRSWFFQPKKKYFFSSI